MTIVDVTTTVAVLDADPVARLIQAAKNLNDWIVANDPNWMEPDAYGGHAGPFGAALRDVRKLQREREKEV